MTDATALLSEVSQQLARFPRLLDLLLGELDEATWRSRPAPAEWSPVEIVCHLRDEETPGGGRTRPIARLGRASRRRAAVRPRPPGRVGDPRQTAPPPARRDLGALVGQPVGAAPRRLREADPLRLALSLSRGGV